VIDLKLDIDYNLSMKNGDLELIIDGPEVAQNAGIRLLFIEGENFFNFLIGVPWYDAMFDMTTSYEQKAKILKDTIRKTPGVNQILRFEFGLNPDDHLATVEFTADTVYGEITAGIGL